MVSTKGQIISERNYGVLNFPKNSEIIVRISASKMGQINKILAHYHAKLSSEFIAFLKAF